MNPLLTFVKKTVDNIMAPILRHAWSQVAPDIRTLNICVPSGTSDDEITRPEYLIMLMLKGKTPFHDLVVFWSLIARAAEEQDNDKVRRLVSIVKRVDSIMNDENVPSLYRLLTAYAAAIVISDRDIHDKTKDEEIPKIIKLNFAAEILVLRKLGQTAVPPSDMILEWCRGFKVEEIPSLWRERLHMNIAGSRLLKVCGVILASHQSKISALENGPEIIRFLTESKTLGSWVTLAFHARLKGAGTIPAELNRELKSLIAHLRLELGESFWNSLIVSKALHPDCLRNVTPRPSSWTWQPAIDIINDNRWMSIVALPEEDIMCQKQKDFRFWGESVEVLEGQEPMEDDKDLRGLSKKIGALAKFNKADNFDPKVDKAIGNSVPTKFNGSLGPDPNVINVAFITPDSAPIVADANPKIKDKEKATLANHGISSRSRTPGKSLLSTPKSLPKKTSNLPTPDLEKLKKKFEIVVSRIEAESELFESTLPAGLNDLDFGPLTKKQ